MITWAYVAGFCDGEGTIRRNYIRFYQRDPLVLDQIAEWLNTQGVYCYVTCRKTPRVTNFLVINQESALNINRAKDIQRFIVEVIPYLIVKKVVAQDTLRYMRMFPSSQKINGFLGNERLAAGARHQRRPHPPGGGAR